jgi:two-component system, LytTR family, sensor kinase
LSSVATQQRWRPSPALLTVGAWTLIAATFIAQNVVNEVARGRPVSWEHHVYNEGVYWFAFALLTPLLVWLSRRFSLIAPPRTRALRVHLLASPAVAALQVLLYFTLLGLTAIALGRLAPSRFPAWLIREPDLALFLTMTAFWKYWVIVALIHGIEYARMYAREHRQASELRQLLTAAQLDQLKARLQPHFLFNTLNGIAVLMRDEPERARTMLVRLSELLRSVIDAGDEQVVPLHEEMALVQRYLDIQQMRFAGRLEVSLDVSPAAAGHPVPHFLIQPLDENAVQHGVARSERGGTVSIRVRDDASHLDIEVADKPNGALDLSMDSPGSGIGLTTTRERLTRLYGDRYRFSMDAAEGGGTVVTLRIPIDGFARG